MKRLTDAILGADIAYAQGRQNKMLDLRHGGQMAFAPQLNQITSDQPYVSRPVIALMIAPPAGFEDLPNSEYWIEALRACVETRALKWTGLDSTLNVQVDETSPVGGAGEMHQDFTNVTRERSNPILSLQELVGLPVKSLFEGWVTNLMMDPNSKIANVATMGKRKDLILSDYYGMTCAFIEPDPTHSMVIRSWLCTNMFPSGRLAQSEGSRDLTQAMQHIAYDINFTAITQVGYGVDFYCQQLLDNINIVGANPQQRQAFTQYETSNGGLGSELVDASIRDRGFGYKEVTESLPNNNIQLG